MLNMQDQNNGWASLALAQKCQKLKDIKWFYLSFHHFEIIILSFNINKDACTLWESRGLTSLRVDSNAVVYT